MSRIFVDQTSLLKDGPAPASRRPLVFTNGCFDVLHAGHISCLEQAKAMGAFLVVGLNSDRSIRALKGAARPVNPFCDRALVLAALRCVDLVVGFDQADPLDLIKALGPDILVKGGDWPVEEVVGGSWVRARGGRVATIPLLEGRSTSRILAHAQHCR